MLKWKPHMLMKRQGGPSGKCITIGGGSMAGGGMSVAHGARSGASSFEVAIVLILGSLKRHWSVVGVPPLL